MTDRQTVADELRATETLAFDDMPGDDGAHELSADLPEDTAACDAADLVEHFADDAPPEERVPARTGDGRALIDTAPAVRDSGRARRCGWSATLICETASVTRT